MNATTALEYVLRPQSSLRFGVLLNSGRGRFFIPATVSDPSHPTPIHTRPLVAIVEGDAGERGTLTSLLSDLPVDIEGFASAESFLEAAALQPLCLITDVSLPGMSGIELVQQLRTHGFAPPVILLGEESDIVSAVAGMRAGASDFVEKTQADFAIARRVLQLIGFQVSARERQGKLV